MRTLVFVFFLIFGMPLMMGNVGGGAGSAHAQVLDDGANMKILRARAELARGSQTRVYSGGQLKSKAELEKELRGRATCGAVDIGNQSINTEFTGQVTIVISGDVVNSGNNCR
ncbi:hypothetical protein ACFL12_05920 [Pseudomonadota bacterium]